MNNMAAIVAALKNGRVAIVPTESSYALAACVATDAASSAACARIAALKKRPHDKAFPVVATLDQLECLVDSEWALHLRRLADCGLWPGPLSVAVAARDGLPAEVVDAGRVAVRIPNHDALATLCASVGAPLTATSANRSGEPPIVDPREAARLFPDVPLLDAGVLSGGAPSTVVSVSETFDVTLVRAGAIPWSRVSQTLAEVLRG